MIKIESLEGAISESEAALSFIELITICMRDNAMLKYAATKRKFEYISANADGEHVSSRVCSPAGQQTCLLGSSMYFLV